MYCDYRQMTDVIYSNIDGIAIPASPITIHIAWIGRR